MRVLLSTFGSRGDVQPMVALGLELRSRGIHVRICAPPNFADFVDGHGHGLDFTPMGHDLREGPKHVPGGPATTTAAQFDSVGAAAADCDVVVGCAALQIAAHSVAEARGIPYRYAAYAPVALPSPHHGPLPVYPPVEPAVGASTHLQRWSRDAQWWNDTWRAPLNACRAKLGLSEVDDVRHYVVTDHPMLAADPTIAPWRTPAELDVVQTGAWLLEDERPLTPEVQAFLDAGEPPIYVGFGSMLVPRAPVETIVDTARMLGRRAIVLRGWAQLELSDATEVLLVDEVNQQALFPRVSAVVHHGGSGTTTVAARAGVPQVVLPHHYDQPYYAERVCELGIGVGHPADEPTVTSLADAVTRALLLATRAGEFAPTVRRDGAAAAARELLQDKA